MYLCVIGWCTCVVVDNGHVKYHLTILILMKIQWHGIVEIVECALVFL
jgi:hypothetical protein